MKSILQITPNHSVLYEMDESVYEVISNGINVLGYKPSEVIALMPKEISDAITVTTKKHPESLPNGMTAHIVYSEPAT